MSDVTRDEARPPRPPLAARRRRARRPVHGRGGRGRRGEPVGHGPDGPVLLAISAVALLRHGRIPHMVGTTPRPRTPDRRYRRPAARHGARRARNSPTRGPHGAGPQTTPGHGDRAVADADDGPGRAGLAGRAVHGARPARVDILSLQTHPLARGHGGRVPAARARRSCPPPKSAGSCPGPAAPAPGSSGPTPTTWWTRRPASSVWPPAPPWTPPNSPWPCASCSAGAPSGHCPPRHAAAAAMTPRAHPSRGRWRTP